MRIEATLRMLRESVNKFWSCISEDLLSRL
jgi:hypothetical protein